MKINWSAILLWVLLIAIAAGGIYGWRSLPAEKAQPLPAPTVTVQPPAVVPPIIIRPVTAPVTKSHPKTTNKPAYKPALKRVPGGPLVDCKQVPPVAKTLPWNQVQSAALQRGMTAAQIAELKTCMGK